MTFGAGTGLIKGDVGPFKAYDMMRMCFEHGVNFFDCAEGYGGPGGVSEKVFAEAYARGVKEGVWERKDLVISTKLYFSTRPRGEGSNPTPNVGGLSRKHLEEGLAECLARMQLDYVDLLFCHRPDPGVKIEEVVRTMSSLIQRGKVFYWGTSEWSATMLQTAVGYADRFGLEPPLFDQCEYSLIKRHRVEREYQPLYPDLGLTVWSPLAGGALTGKYKRDAEAPAQSRLAKTEGAMHASVSTKVERCLDIVERLRPLCEELGCSTAQLAVAWAVRNPNVSTAIIGASSVEQLEETLGAVAVVPRLTPEVLQRIEEAAGTEPEWDEVHRMVAGTHKSRRVDCPMR